MGDLTPTGIPREISRAMRGWTKWGGANRGYQHRSPTWYCQACCEEESDQLPAYLISIVGEDYARICSVCFNKALQYKIHTIFKLIILVRQVDL